MKLLTLRFLPYRSQLYAVSVPPPDNLGLLGASAGSSTLGTDQVRNALRYSNETS